MTPIVETTIRGRYGRYQLRVYDQQDATRAMEEVELMAEDDVVLRWGEQRRSPLKQVLKSYAELTFKDPKGQLQNTFRGDYDPARYPVQVDGPGVLWVGYVRQQTRPVSLSRTSVNQTVLRLHGGLERANSDDVKALDTGYRPLDVLEEARVQALDQLLTRSDADLRGRDTSTIYEPTGDQYIPLNSFLANLYQAGISWARMTKGLFYRSLSEGGFVYEPARQVGTLGTVEQVPVNRVQRVSTDRSAHQVTGSLQNLITNDGSKGELRDLDAVGTVIVTLDKEHQLMSAGASTVTQNDDQTYLRDDDLGDRTATLTARLVNDGGLASSVTDETVTNLGEFDLAQELKVRLDIEAEKISGVTDEQLTVELKYQGNDGSTETATGFSTTVVEGPLTTSLINPVVRLEGRGARVRIRARFVDANDRAVEQVMVSQSDRGLEDVKVEDYAQPLVDIDPDFVITDPREARSTRLTSLSVEHVQPWMVEAIMTAKARPFGVQTLQARLDGLHGPETVVLLTDGVGPRAFVATAREVNLRKGVTRVTDVELPIHTLS